ncbi:molecular chaperone, partial [Proteus mirabilis]|nr:molecular chaperone [Proteus mirabilis]
VSLYAHDDGDINEQDIRQFLVTRGSPVTGSATESFGALLLAASWLEDIAAQDDVLAQTQLFDTYV